MQNRKTIYLIGAIITLIIWLNGFNLTSALCFPIFFVALFIFVRNLSTAIPFRELALVVASLQLLVSSFMAFYIQAPNPIFMPKIPAETYFDFAVPGIILFGIGLFAFKPKQNLDADLLNKIQNYDLFDISKKFILTGWFSFFILPYTPGVFGYFVNLLVFLSYIGGIIMLFTSLDQKKKWIWVGIAFLPVVRDALFAGIFFLAMIWIAYFTIYYLFKAQKTFWSNALIIALGLYIVIVTDTAKKDYRTITGEQKYNLNIGDKALLFTTLFFDNVSFKTITSQSNVSARITRANQGALVTWVMVHTPAKQPFGNGETIKDAVIAAIFPRFLMPNKAQTGGKVLFERYTGYQLNDTSMNLSLLGEGWANYGYWGGLLFMFCVGAFYSWAYRIFSSLIQKYPIYFFFIPFIFIYTIKAEDDLLTPLNHIFKASIVLIIIHHVYIKKIYPK